MRACLYSLSLVYCPLILSNSESGVFTQRPNTFHRSSLMTSRTVERFSGVRLDSGNTTGEMTEGEKERVRVHSYRTLTNLCEWQTPSFPIVSLATPSSKREEGVVTLRTSSCVSGQDPDQSDERKYE